MLIRLIPAIIVCVALFLAFRHWKQLPKSKQKTFALKALIYGAFILCLVAAITGHAHWLVAVFTGLLAAAKYGFRAFPLFKILGQSELFKNAVFKTEFLHLQLNIKTGQISGTIVSGPHQGSSLESLTSEELKTLEKHYKNLDKTSYYLIRVIRQRGGHQYKESDQHQKNQSSGLFQANPSTNEAQQILGLSNNPDKQQIIKAHRSLIQKLHPDRGGNDYLASRVNLAKDVLLQNIEHNH